MISENNSYGYVYKTIINNFKSKFHECYYLGLRTTNTFNINEILNDNYYGSGRYIKIYKKKYDNLGLSKEVLFITDEIDKLKLKEKEVIGDLFITDAFSNNGKCLNLKAGGENGLLSEETKSKISETNKKKINYVERSCIFCNRSFIVSIKNKENKNHKKYCSKNCSKYQRDLYIKQYTNEIINLYNIDNLSQREIAKKFKVSQPTIRSILINNNIPMKSKGFVSKTQKKGVDKFRKSKMIKNV